MWASRQLHQGSELSCHLEDASGAWQPVEWLAEGVGDPVHHPGGVARLLQTGHVGDGAGLHRLRELAPGG